MKDGRDILKIAEFKKNNKVVVTGGSGFVGSATIKELEKQGYQTLNFDLKTGCDIRKLEQLLTAIESGDKVLHLAAIARFNEADADPLLAYETNVIGSANVATACEAKGAERLVYSSTGSVYMPISEEPPITEKFQARGNSVYGCSKYLGELVIKKNVGDIPFIVLRYAHLYGEGKLGWGAVGIFVDRVNRGLKPTLYGGRQSNDFTYIKDIVQANLLALETMKMNEVYNIGTGEELTTEKAFEIMGEVLGYTGEFEVTPQREVDAARFVYDIGKASGMLGYKPKYDFIKGLKDYLKK